jgi:putative tryptophan/tyrosine transport system substrate-binding protein
MRRREFIAGVGSAAAWPAVVRAQQSERVRHVGVLMNTVQEDPGGQPDVTAFRQGLTELGWVEGRNVDIEFRWPGGDIERVQTFAKELVGLRPDVLIGRSTPTTVALKRETATIPIIFVNVPEPVEQGFVQSLARPGGNITGFTNFEASIGGKWLQLLKEVDPRLMRIGIIYNSQTAPFAGLFLRVAPRVGVEIIAMPVQSETDIAATLTSLAQRPGSGMVQILDSYTLEHRDVIIDLAARLSLPAIYSNRIATPSGGLISYAVDDSNQFQRAATYVDRILNGAKPADLPVQQPTRFELSINLKTAKALGLEIPSQLLATADEVIE